jgi:site-specific DNA recombinase
VNSNEARRVHEIFELYSTHRSLSFVVAELPKRGWSTKSWKSRSNIRHAGRSFTKASLRMLLSSATYCGKVNYRGVVYQGEHKAIIEPVLWDDINSDFSSRPKPGNRFTDRQCGHRALVKSGESSISASVLGRSATGTVRATMSHLLQMTRQSR